MHDQPFLFDSPLRWFVPTDSGDPYLVDLESFDGNGECACAHFGFRLVRELEAGKRGAQLRCKHIRAALAAYNLANPGELRQ